MNSEQIGILIASFGGSGVATTLLVWWLKGALTNLSKVSGLEKSVKDLDSTVKAFSGELKAIEKAIYQNQKDLAVLEKSQETQWQRYDDITQTLRDAKL